MDQGIGSTRLEPPEDRVRKSISTETTFRDNADRTALLGRKGELFYPVIRLPAER
jgi:hypothetical protein